MSRLRQVEPTTALRPRTMLRLIVVYNPRLPGQYFDTETGLNYNDFRDYDPATGRYVESDPIGLRGGMNIYTYVFDATIMLNDPSGLEAVSWLIHQQHKQEKGCGGRCQGPDRWKHTVDGSCQTGDAFCAQAMQAAGLPGPYWSTDHTYSLGCLLSLGVGAKSAELATIEQGIKAAPNVTKTVFGASEEFASFLGDYLHRLGGWPSTVFMSPLAIKELLNLCECKNGG
jgi:RHS repeat-associated protein